MSKIKIKVVTIGHMPPGFDKSKVEKWKSEIFEVSGLIENYSLTSDSDGDNWEYSDDTLKEEIPAQFEGDFLIAITNVPLHLNWYSRRLGENKVVVTFHEMRDILLHDNLPLENLIYRILYAYSLVYKRQNNRIPDKVEATNFTHDETRGCLFDMNGIKTEVIHSCDHPIICDDCVERMKNERVSTDTINSAKKEIKAVKKERFYRITDFIKRHPIWALIISGISAIILGAIGSIIANIIYEFVK